MILLDTNILSELMRSEPEQRVLMWADELDRNTAYISAINQAEILQGVLLLPEGKRKQRLLTLADHMFGLFASHILPFDEGVAMFYADVIVNRQKQGCPIHFQDAQIAAIAIKNHCSLATRNVSDFDGIEQLEVINPWID